MSKQKKQVRGRRNPKPDLDISVAADTGNNTVLMKFTQKIAWVGLPRGMALSLAETLKEHAEKLAITHGVDCEKKLHDIGDGFLHAENQDEPFDDEGLSYCGRCHTFLGQTIDLS